MSDLPVSPSGWNLLIQPIEVKTHTESGIALPPESVKAQEYLRYVGKVVAAGPLCYQDEKFFRKNLNGPDTHHPFCKVGDWVMFGRHAGQDVVGRTDGKVNRYKLVHDDEIKAVVSDPNFIETPM